MYSTCLFCTEDLGASDVVETLPSEWRQAEELAKISDNLAFPATADAALDQRKG